MDDEFANKYTPAQKLTVYSKLHTLIDKHLSRYKESWQNWLAQGKTDAFYKRFSKCVEAATFEFSNDNCSKHQYKGRGTINIKEVNESIQTSYSPDVGGVLSPLTKEGTRLLKQSRRLTAIRNNLQSLSKCKANGDPDKKVGTLSARIKEANKLVVGEWAKGDGHEDLVHKIRQADIDEMPNFFALTRVIEEFTKRSLKSQLKTLKSTSVKTRLASKLRVLTRTSLLQ